MAEIKTREKFKGIKALDKAAVAGERMKRAFVRSKDQAENLLDDGQISPSEYAEDMMSRQSVMRSYLPWRKRYVTGCKVSIL